MLTWIVFILVAVGLIGLWTFPAVGWWALLGLLGSLGLAIALVVGFDAAGRDAPGGRRPELIPQLGVRFQLGVDGLSIFLVHDLAALGGGDPLVGAQHPDRPRNYFFMVGLAQTATLGALLAQDLLLFVLFDPMLVPLYFLVGQWGTGDRIPRRSR